jgi:hypothetical protein
MGFKLLFQRSKELKDTMEGLKREEQTEPVDLNWLALKEGTRSLKMPSSVTPHESRFVEVPARFAILACELIHRGL